MNVYFRSRAIYRTTLVVLGIAAAEMITGSSEFRLFSAASVAIPWAFILPLALSIATMHVVVPVLADLETTSVRAFRRIDVSLRLVILLLAATALAAFTLFRVPDDAELATQLVRNSIGMIGLGWIAVSLVGMSTGWIAPLIFEITALIAGRDTFHVPLWWAWILQPSSNVPSVVAALLLGLGGALLSAIGHPGRQRS